MLKVILRMLADIVCYAITMPIRVVLLLMWILGFIIGIIKHPETAISDTKDSIIALKNTLRAEGYWIKHGYIPDEFELS